MTRPKDDGAQTSDPARVEVERAANFYYHSPLQLGIDSRTKRLIIERCTSFIRPPRVLDLGYVDGNWTEVALGRGARVDIVEGASRHVALARERYAGRPDVRIFDALFQDFEPDVTYDTIIAGDMLRYVPDDVEFLARMSRSLMPGGHLIATVPNRRSLHRRVGAALGIEPNIDEPNVRDREVGNRRSYDRYTLRHALTAGGLEVVELRGCFLKPLSSAQMQDWSDELLRAFLHVGDELEDYCWFLYALARKP
jgi:SAM-dependent methyltransferase